MNRAQSSALALRALRRKEWIESKPAILVGLIIFVGLPTLWTLLLWSLDTHAGVMPGIASMLWLLAGALFSAVLGAQAICRDFGSPTERFLFSRPIEPRRVMRLKAMTGFLIVFGLTALIGGLELLWSALIKSPRRDDQIPVGLLILGTGLAMAAYWISVAAACATRRSLTSTLAAAFVLTLVLTVPVIVRIPGVNDITDLVFRDENNFRTTLIAAAVVAVFAFVAGIAMRWAASTERRLDVGPRTMAWVVGLTLMALFVTAMHEVGASESIVASWWVPSARETIKQCDTPLYQIWKIAAGMNRVAVLCSRESGPGTQVYSPEHSKESVFLIDVDADGQITRERNTSFFLDKQTSYPASTIDSTGNVAFVGLSRIGPEPHQLGDPWKMSLQRFDWETGTRISAAELPWPVTSYWTMVKDLYCTDEHVLVLITTSDRLGVALNLEGVVAEYRINTSSTTLERTQRFRFDYHDRTLDPSWVELRGFKSEAAIRVVSRKYYDIELQPVREGEPYGAFTVNADQFGLKVFPVNRSASPRTNWPTELDGSIGRVHATPWAVLFRAVNPDVVPAGADRLLEIHDSSVIQYDVSDPTRPRRMANIAIPLQSSATVMGDLVVMNHGIGFSIAKLPPVTKK